MKIVIAAWHLMNMNVGLGRYTKNLIAALGRVDRRHDYEILMPVETTAFFAYENFRYRFCQFPILKRRFWEQVATWLVGPYDLLHFPYDSCVVRKRGKFVVTIHDVKPLLFPHSSNHMSMSKLFKRMFMPRPFEIIDHVITVSKSSQADIVRRLEVPQERVTVIPQGVEHDKFSPRTEFVNPHGQQIPYVLSVAGADPTKNLVSLIDAFSQLPDNVRTRHQLLLIGDIKPQGTIRDLVDERGLTRQVVFTGIISDEKLVRYYQDASVFVFPSLYEGFGLPALEAMACGCPVVCSNTSSLPEVVGDAALMVTPTDVTALEQSIRQVLTDENLRHRLREAGIRQAGKFSWDQTAKETVALYERVVFG
ncbi:MAG: glycosyltransferase family 4 protein [Nitrospirales bacterium]|nr:glycosyltransferase family 4 protein [Nitrospira sp.]MDR4502404.1 glycosyltransferase family 4 protein [Nitrospirales bacterium]